MFSSEFYVFSALPVTNHYMCTIKVNKKMPVEKNKI